MTRACHRCGEQHYGSTVLCATCRNEQVGECELCHEVIANDDVVGVFGSALCHQECAERALDAAEAARASADDAYHYDRG